MNYKNQLSPKGTVFSEKTERIGKKILLGFIAFIIFLFIWGSFLEEPDPSSYAVKRTPTSTITKTEVVEQVNIRVTSQIVKKVDKKYRYFFDIRNHDDIPFSGTVKIELFNKKGNKNAYNSFDTNPTIEPNIGKSVYIDAYTGPSSVHSDYAINSFKFEILKNNVVISSGNGTINE